MSFERKQHRRDYDIFVRVSLVNRFFITSALPFNRFLTLTLDPQFSRGPHKPIYNSTTIQRLTSSSHSL